MRACRAARLHSEREGGYSVLEAAIVLPAVFGLLMLLVQWAIVWHARSVAAAAAQEGLRTSEAYGASAAAGQANTMNYLAQVAPHSLPGPQVTVTRGPTTASVHVHARVLSLIPFGDFHVDETATGPIERYVPEASGFTNPDAARGAA